jgi:hypothetical protein
VFLRDFRFSRISFIEAFRRAFLALASSPSAVAGAACSTVTSDRATRQPYFAPSPSAFASALSAFSQLK